MAGANLAMAGTADYFYLGLAAAYEYYVIDRFAPGIEVAYTHFFPNRDYGYDAPHTLSTLPYAKFVISRSHAASPYLMVAGGFQVEWGSAYAVNAGIAGGGGGVHVALGSRVSINIRALALHYWYDDPRVYGYSDDRVYRDGNQTYICNSAADCDLSQWITANKLLDGSQYQACDDSDGAEQTNCGFPKYYCRPEAALSDDTCIAPSSDLPDKKRELIFPLITLGMTFFF